MKMEKKYQQNKIDTMRILFSIIIMLLLDFFAISNVASAQTPFFVANSQGAIYAINEGNDIYYFKYIDSSATYTQQLWKVNTSNSTNYLVKSFGPLYGPYGDVSNALFVNNKLYFVMYISPGDHQLWVSDGTDAGTKPLFTSSKIYAFFDFNNALFFSAFSYTNMALNGMYKTDGTPTNTILLKNFQSRYEGTSAYSGIANYTKYNNKIVFTVHKGVINNPTTHYAELWSTDGTAAGFVKLDSLYGSIGVYGKKSPYSDYTNTFPELNDMLYFTFVNNANYNTSEIWRTNGTVNNSSYLHDLGPSANTSPIISFNNKLILTAYTASYGQEIYISDSSKGSINLLKDINSNPGFLSSNPKNFLIHCNKFFFIARDSSNSFERIWESDATTNGTKVNTPNRGLYSLITKLNDGNLYYAYRYSVNSVDSIKIFMIDSTCTTTEVLKWAVLDYGNVSQIMLSNSVILRLGGGQAGPMGLYSLSPTTTINQVEKSNNQLTIYPNPLNDVLNFNVSKNSNIKIYDLVGNIVFEQSFLKGQHSINLKHLSNGLYFIIDDRGGVQKFIKE